MIIMPYYSSDLIHYITKDFYKINWYLKLNILKGIISGLINLHSTNIFHRDLHSGNIFSNGIIGDLGISKSATAESTDDNENYGIIPYMAPEIFQGQKYTKKSDLYSFGMIMWELMTGRRPFWDQNRDTELIIKIYDGLRPPIITNAPKDYVKLMQECWKPNPRERSDDNYIIDKLYEILDNEVNDPTEIIKLPDIIPTNNPKSSLIFTLSSSSLESGN